jgi:hypothetical protein
MPPKNEYTIPMGKSVNVVTTTRGSKREVRTVEKVAPLPSSKQRKSSKASGSRQQMDTIDADVSEHPTESTEEVHHLRPTEAQEDEDEIQGSQTESNVCTTDLYMAISLIASRLQWING